ncbi:hypothetical protein D3C77_695300 [compost metagenome]
MFFKHLELPANRTMGDMQLLGRVTDTVQAGSGFEGAKRIQRRKVMAHWICEFS